MHITKTLLLLLSALNASSAYTFELSQRQPPETFSGGMQPGIDDKALDAPGPGLKNPRTWFAINVTFGFGPEDDENPPCSKFITAENSTTTVGAEETHSLLLDWYSRNMWVVQQGCKNCNFIGDETQFGYTLSSDEADKSDWVYVMDDGRRFWNSDQIDGEPYVTGYEVRKNISLGGFRTSWNIPVTVANHVEGFPVTSDLRGIFPLAPAGWANGDITEIPSFKYGPDRHLIRRARRPEVIHDVLGFSISRTKKASLSINCIPPSYSNKSSAMAEVIDSGISSHYVVKLDSVIAEGDVMSTIITSSPKAEARIDPGVMYWSAPVEHWTAFYQRLGGKFVYSNNNLTQYGILPVKPRSDTNVTIRIDGKPFVVAYDSLLNTDTSLIPPDDPTYRYGTLLYTNSTSAYRQWILGTSFLENVYVAFTPSLSRVQIWPLEDNASRASGGSRLQDSFSVTFMAIGIVGVFGIMSLAS